MRSITFQLLLFGLVLLLSIGSYSQSTVHPSPDKTAVRDRSEVRQIVMSPDLDFTSIASSPDGTVYLGGSIRLYHDDKRRRIRNYGVLATISDGTTTFEQLPFLSDIRNIFFLNNSVGWIAGDHLYRTTDGTKTWERLTITPQIANPLVFVDRDLGWSVDGNYKLRRIAGGKTDVIYTFRNVNNIKRLQFAPREIGWVLPTGGTGFLRTTDGGTKWEAVDIDQGVVSDLHLTHAGHGYATTFTGLYRTEDNGSSWKLIKKSDERSFASRLVFLNDETGWSFGSKLCSIRDSGTHVECWDRPDEVRNIVGITFTDPTTGWLLTTESLFKSEDGGRSWHRHKLVYGDKEF